MWPFSSDFTGFTGAMDPTLVRAIALYGTVAIVGGLAWWRRSDRQRLGVALLVSLWMCGPLLAFNNAAQALDWWQFADSPAEVASVPFDVWFTWTALWAGAAVLIPSRKYPLWQAVGVVVGAAVADLFIMPLHHPMVEPSGSWLIGETVAVVAILIPAVALARWTLLSRRLSGRVFIQLIGFASILLYVLPSLIFEATGEGWQVLAGRSPMIISLGLVLAAPGALIAVAGVVELARSGRGTPFPLDPPTRLVTSGPYAFIANPMQMGATLILAIFGFMVGSWAVVLGAVGAFAFSAGYARVFEHAELDERFGDVWRRYQAEVPSFRFRWHPYDPEPGTIWVAASCGQCTETGDFLERLAPQNITRRAAEEAVPAVRRITYESVTGERAAGLAAISCLLDHTNLALAMAGWPMRIPVLGTVLQAIADVSGAQPIDLAAPATSRVDAPTG